VTNIEQVELTVRDKGIHCSGCEARIESVLGKVPGVLRVKADHATQKVNVTLDTDRTPADEVKQRLELVGYRTG